MCKAWLHKISTALFVSRKGLKLAENVHIRFYWFSFSACSWQPLDDRANVLLSHINDVSVKVDKYTIEDVERHAEHFELPDTADAFLQSVRRIHVRLDIRDKLDVKEAVK